MIARIRITPGRIPPTLIRLTSRLILRGWEVPAYRMTTVMVNRRWSAAQARASPQVVRVAVITAVPRASAVNKVCTGVQPMPGMPGQVLGRGSRRAGPSWRSTAGTGLACTFQYELDKVSFSRSPT